jgi:hypothetical protein
MGAAAAGASELGTGTRGGSRKGFRECGLGGGERMMNKERRRPDLQRVWTLPVEPGLCCIGL